MFIVSDNILDRLTCSQCKKYLSVKNTKVYPNRGIKCGRCSKSEDAGVVSMFGVLAEEALFRCVNRFEGCNQLLSYSEVAEHEKICVGTEYDSSCCTEEVKGTAYEIYIHFKEHHKDRLLVNTPEIVLEIDNELVKSYLYLRNDLLFFINVRYSPGEEELVLNVMYVGTDHDASKISQMFTLHSLDRKLKYKTKRKSCCSINGGNVKCFRIGLSSGDFPKNVIVCKFDLNTENVDSLVILPGNFKKMKRNIGNMETSPIIKSADFHPRLHPVEILRSSSANGSAQGSKPSSTSLSSNSFIGPLTGNYQPVSTTASCPSSKPITTTLSSSVFNNISPNQYAEIVKEFKTPLNELVNSTLSSPFGRPVFSSGFGKSVNSTSSSPFGQPVVTVSENTRNFASSGPFGQPVVTVSENTSNFASSGPFFQPVVTVSENTSNFASSGPFGQPPNRSVFGKSFSCTSSAPFGESATMSGWKFTAANPINQSNSGAKSFDFSSNPTRYNLNLNLNSPRKFGSKDAKDKNHGFWLETPKTISN